jgi:hypothetical protein
LNNNVIFHNHYEPVFCYLQWKTVQ